MKNESANASYTFCLQQKSKWQYMSQVMSGIAPLFEPLMERVIHAIYIPGLSFFDWAAGNLLASKEQNTMCRGLFLPLLRDGTCYSCNIHPSRPRPVQQLYIYARLRSCSGQTLLRSYSPWASEVAAWAYKTRESQHTASKSLTLELAKSILCNRELDMLAQHNRQMKLTVR